MTNLTNNLEENQLQEINQEISQKPIKAKRIGSMYFLEKRDYLRPFDKLRYWIYRATDINPNRGRLSVWLVVSLIYNLVMTLMPLMAIVPIIMNYAAAPSMATGDVNNITENDFIKFNNMMGKYMYVEFVFSFILLLDWCVRILYCDFKYPLVVGRWKSVFSYLFNPYNLYQISSAIVLIALFSTYGSIENHYWFIDINVLGANYDTSDKVSHAQALYNSWNPGELIFVSIYIANVFLFVPRVVLGFREQTPFKSKVSLWATLKKRWKTPVIATVFLIVLLFVFSFLILKSEQSFYAEWAASHEGSLADAPNYSSSPKNIGQSLWYCLITVTTVGYGQIIPQSPAGRVIAVVLVIVGISYYSFYSVFFVSTYTNFIDKKDQADQEKSIALQKKQEQDELVKTIKSEFVQELLKYGVIDQNKYQQVEQQKADEANKQQRILNAQANKKAKSMLNSNLLIQNEESKLKGWLKTYSLDISLKKKSEEHVLTQDELSDAFNYEIINSPDLQENYQAIMIKLDSNIVNKIFNGQSDESINLFFKKVAPTYKVKKVIIVDKLLNTIVGEVSIKDILLTTNEIAWDKFGSQSGLVEQMFEVEYNDVSLIYIYLIEARKKYLEPKGLAAFDVNKDQLTDFVFLKQNLDLE